MIKTTVAYRMQRSKSNELAWDLIKVTIYSTKKGTVDVGEETLMSDVKAIVMANLMRLSDKEGTN